MTDTKHLIELLKNEKTRQKLTIRELSNLSGIALGTLNKLLSSDGQGVKTQHILSLANALKIPLGTLFDEKTTIPKADDEFLGYVTVSASALIVKVGDVSFNVAAVVERLRQLNQKGVKLAVFPELCLTGYSCHDLFFQWQTNLDVLCGIENLLQATRHIDTVFAVGAPLNVENVLYNTAIVIFKGKILGVVPKTYLPNYNEFNEKRFFSPAPKQVKTISLCGQDVSFGTKIIFRNNLCQDFSFACEVCADLWAITPPSSIHSQNGANIILNLSASNEILGKADYRRNLVLGQSGRTASAYIYASAGPSESTSEVLFSGHCLVAEYKRILAETPLFSHEDAICEIDLITLVNQRLRIYSNLNFDGKQDGYVISAFDLPLKNPNALLRTISQTPFVPEDKEVLESRCQQILSMQAHALAKRIEITKASKLILGVSGGLDSTLALIASTKALKLLNRPNSDILGVTMPCFGTTQRTKNNGLKLLSKLGATALEIDITKSVLQHFSDINHPKNLLDTTYENAQARERTQVLMDLANKHNGLVVGTGDLSEIALGWSTFNGDQMSMYGLNAGIPKTLLPHLLKFAGKKLGTEIQNILVDILATPISPELLPHNDQEIAQQTESLVGPYILHDFFLFHFVRSGFSKRKILFLAKLVFKNAFDEQTIEKWLNVFLKRFFSQQFKRNCSPDSVKIGSVFLSPRHWQMVSDVEANNN